ncbi:MAG: magnesium transporter MgtE N-terminal domain-containing protein [Candidatus Levyibacteriota bacterium]
MIYFSELKGKKVFQGHKTVGRLEDCLFLPSDPALITKIVVKKGRNVFIYPLEEVAKIGRDIKLKPSNRTEERSVYELSLLKNLLDKQIIDVKGGKVVRVNDVALQPGEGGTYYITGVDIGFRAILRWLKLEKASVPLYKAFRTYSHPHVLAWSDIEPLELARGNVQLKKEVQDLERMRPEDLADYLEKTNVSNVNEIITQLDDQFAADVISDLNVNYQMALFERFSSDKAAKFMTFIDPDEAADILLSLPDDKRKQILGLLPKRKKNELVSLLKYSKTPIGELINPEYIWVSETDSAKAGLEAVKKMITTSHFTSYVYVFNLENQLSGVIKLSDLITHAPQKRIKDFMNPDIIAIHLTTPKEITIKKMLKYKLYALPVVESSKKMLGIVMYDDLVEELLKSYEAF